MSINSTGLNGRRDGTDSSKEGLSEGNQNQQANQKLPFDIQKLKGKLSKRLFSQYHKRGVGTEENSENPSQNPDASL
jgi:hypothetical protein